MAKKIEQQISNAVDRVKPDVLNSVLLRLDESRERDNIMDGMIKQAENTMLFPPAEKKKKFNISKTMVKWTAGIAAALLIGFSSIFAYGSLAVQSVVGLDVNPSLEIRVNSREKVISVNALNQDAEKIVDGMDLKNVDLNVAVNAMIGSMLKNGYVSEAKNSILITVESKNPKKGEELQARLSDDVSSLLEAYSVGGAVLSQTVEDDKRLMDLAAEHNISLGKAALVDLVVSQNSRLAFEDIAKLSINDINLLLADKDAELTGVKSRGNASSEEYIGKDKATEIALVDAGIAKEDANYIKTVMEYDDGRMVYEVEFYHLGAEYEYEIDALNGNILESKREGGEKPSKPPKETTPGADIVQPTAAPQSGQGGQGGSEQIKITENKAKEIAFKDAGFSSEKDVVFTKVKLDKDDGKYKYDIEFYSGSTEYDYEIDAFSGVIVEWDKEENEKEYHGSNNQAPLEKPTAAPQPTAAPKPSVSKPEDKHISRDEAVNAALNHAGLSQKDIHSLKVELDHDDNRAVYEVEFKCGGKEYNYDIDPTSAAVLKAEVEDDD